MNGYAWHFAATRDGKPIQRDGSSCLPPLGIERCTGELIMCQSGLHASTRALDALKYAPGAWVRLVEPRGEIIMGDDKLVCSERAIVGSADPTETLRQFARQCALDVLHLWDAPEVVREYLETGDEDLRYDAARAAWAAAWAGAQAGAQNTVLESMLWDLLEVTP